MVQLTILNGKAAGSVIVARRFPFVVGRNQGVNHRIKETGVWDRHFELTLPPTGGVVLRVNPSAFTEVNGERIDGNATLRDGDLICLGHLRIRYALSPARQHDLRLRELVTWIAIGLLGLGQFYLIYQFLP